MDKKLGVKIQQLRKSKGIKRNEVADAIGMSESNYGKMERGDINILADYIPTIARILKVQMWQLFDNKFLVNEPVEPSGYATKEELKQGFREMELFFKAEFQKMREELALKKNSYKITRPRKKK